MAKTSKPKASAKPSATGKLVEEAMKKQEIAKAVAISRAADFRGKGQSTQNTPTPNPSPQGGGGPGNAGAKSPSPLRGGVRGGGNLPERRPAHDGREASGQGVRVSVLPPAERISLRAPAGSVAALSKALGVKLPTKPKTSASEGGRTALWLGPDEWLVIDEDGSDPLADCAKVTQLHSTVGISHRNVAISVIGPNCEGTISSGCPQDLSLTAFPVGACSRTILGKSEIVLLRTAEDAFRVECWRSFSDYVFAFLADAAKDAAA